MSENWIIEVEDLTKVYPPQRSLLGRKQEAKLAVDSVSLQVEEGEIFGLVGPNGAGKTSLIRMLSTMVLPTSGSAHVGGYDVRHDEPAIRRLVGVVSSNERSFYWRLTGRENLRFFSTLYQIPENEADPWRDELLSILGLGEVADRRFDHYSTGQKQRMAIARGLLTRPKVLLMDEPTKGVDPLGAAEIVKLIQGRILQLWRPTILVTSHNLFEIEKLCHRVALMHHGRLVAMGTIDQLRASMRRSDTYVMTVSGLSGERLESLAEQAGGVIVQDSVCRENRVELAVSFAIGSAGFPRLVRALVEQGGDLLSSSNQSESFEQVFHAVIEANMNQTKEAS
jgi:ABC-2 type transport system ATP-binding protein